MLAKEMRFIERFKAQAAKASQVQSRVKKLDKIEKVEPPKRRKTLELRVPAAARARAKTSSGSSTGPQALRRNGHLRRPRPVDPAQGALGGDGRQRRRQVDAAEADRRRDRPRTKRRGHRRAQRQARLLRPARDGGAGARADGLPDRWRRRSRWPTSGRCADAGRLLRLLRATTSTRPAASCRAARRRAWCWRASSTPARTSWCSTSRPTTSTSRPRT